MSYLFSFETKRYKAKADMLYARDCHWLVKYGAKIFAFGGILDEKIKNEVYDTKLDSWEALPDLPCELRETDGWVYQHSVYLVGRMSREVWCFDIPSMQFTPVPNIILPMDTHKNIMRLGKALFIL